MNWESRHRLARTARTSPVSLLLDVLPQGRRPPLREELALLGTAVAPIFRGEEDRRANGADYQGVGASES
jgi:hypothetical protein